MGGGKGTLYINPPSGCGPAAGQLSRFPLPRGHLYVVLKIFLIRSPEPKIGIIDPSIILFIYRCYTSCHIVLFDYILLADRGLLFIFFKNQIIIYFLMMKNPKGQF